MATDTNLQFIREKLNRLKRGIMFNHSQDFMKLPDNMVETLNVDEEGRLWFIVKRPPEFADQCAKNFPARLRLYQKGVFYYMEIGGNASVESYHYDAGGEEALLLRMDLATVEYAEPFKEKEPGALKKYLTNTYHRLLKLFSFHPSASGVYPNIQPTTYE